MTYTVAFADASVTVYKDKLAKVNVNASTSGVTYNISEGSDVIQLFKTNDSYVTLKWLKAGTAKIKATLHGVSAELSVTCVDEDSPAVTEFLYFTNNFAWEEVYIYVWGESGTGPDAWPGTKLTDSVKNADNQDCYKLLFDTALYDHFIVNNGKGAQSVDVSMSLAEWATNNNIYLPGSTDESGHYYVGFANYHATHTYDPTTHKCECGAVDPEWLVEVTFTCQYNTHNDGDLYIVLINDPEPQTWMKMTCYDNEYWSLTTQMIKGTHIKFKVVVGKASGDIWEGGDDRTWTIPDTPETYVCYWQN